MPETNPEETYAQRVRRLMAEQGVRPIKDPGDLKADIWESDDELEAFLRDVRRSRNASVA